MAGEMDSGIVDLPQAIKRRKRKVRTVPKLRNIKKSDTYTPILKNIFQKTMSL